jgi:mono/diheme cytochrome c family protein
MGLCVIVLGTTLVADAADVEHGKKLYGQFCASCHGQSGKGDGPAAAALNPKPRNHTDKEYMSKLTDEDLFKVIKEGGASVGKSPLMPPWGASLKDDQIKDVIAFVRTLSGQ